MKIIEALKKIKDLQRKAEDLRGKIGKYCVHYDYETPTYQDQKGKVSEWLQAHMGIVKEILKLRLAIQKTNVLTLVDIEIGGKKVTNSIAGWIHIRRDLAKMDETAWGQLGDKGLKEGISRNTSGESVPVKIVRCYEPTERDKNLEMYRQEPMLIDSTLEVVNAVTDLIEDDE